MRIPAAAAPSGASFSTSPGLLLPGLLLPGLLFPRPRLSLPQAFSPKSNTPITPPLMKLDDPQYEELIRARYNRACIGLFLAGLAALLVSWRLDVAEMMGSAVFVLLIGVVLLYILLVLCARHRYLEAQEQALRDGEAPPAQYLPASRLPSSHMPESLRPGAVRLPAPPPAPAMPRPVRF